MYFRRAGNARQMSQIDHYVRLRVALFVSKKRRRRGISPWQLCRDQRWWQDLGLYRLSGASQPRSTANAREVETVGEPDEGELHVRFDEGRLETVFPRL